MAKLTLNFPRFKVLCNLARNLAITKKNKFYYATQVADQVADLVCDLATDLVADL